MDYMDKYDELKKILTEEMKIDGKMYKLEEEFEKFFVKGNGTAGVRVRKFMQALRRAAEEIRDDVQDYKKTL